MKLWIKLMIMFLLILSTIVSQNRRIHIAQWWASRQSIEEYVPSYIYIRITGDDITGDGTFDNEFATVAKATSVWEPGDTILVKGGVYNQYDYIDASGVIDTNIVIMPYENNYVEFTAFAEAATFINDVGNIYYTPYSDFSRTKTLARINNVYLKEASWSTIATKVDLLNKMTSGTWGIMDSNTSYVEGVSSTQIVDDALIGVSSNFFENSMGYFLANSWSMDYADVSAFDNTTGTVTFSGTRSFSGITNNHYAFINSYNYLTDNGEFWKDEVNNRLYFITPDGGDPNGDVIEVRNLDTLFHMNGHDNITIEGIKFSGGQFIATEESNNCTYINNEFEYNDWEYLDGSNPLLSYQLALGDNNTFINNQVIGICRNFIHLLGANNMIHNNDFNYSGYANRDGSAIEVEDTEEGNKISFNTFDHFAHSIIAGQNFYRGMIYGNEFKYGNLLSWDVGMIGFGNGSYLNSIIYKNVFHHYGVMTAGVYMDSYNSDITIARNISYNSRLGGTQGWGFKLNLPSNNVRLFNNTSTYWGQIEGVSATADKDATGDMIYNNLSNFIIDQDILDGGADTLGNRITTEADTTLYFTDPYGLDFSLLVTATKSIDQGIEIAGITDGFNGSAPDVGALEYGEPMFKFGHDFVNKPPIDTVPDWFVVGGMNYVDDGSFEYPLSTFWTTVTGTPTSTNKNTWNYKDYAKAKNNTYSLDLLAGDAVLQGITGLLPNTTYEVGAFARLLGVNKYDAAYPVGIVQNYTSPSYSHLYNEYSVYNLQVNDNFYIENVDFGTGTPLWDKIGISINSGAIFDIELRLDSDAGTLIGSGTITASDLGWNVKELAISSTTGTHDLYIIVTAVDDPLNRIDEVWFFNTATTETVRIEETTSGSYIDIGSAYFQPDNSFTFSTGPSQTTATIEISKTGGYLIGHVDVISCVEVGEVGEVADYYVDGAGTYTIDDLNNEVLSPGDIVAFERGYEYYGEIDVEVSGTSGNPITYTAYGSGNKPIITGFKDVTTWLDEGSGIYSQVISTSKKTNMVTIDGEIAQLARYPNSGSYLYHETHNAETSITDNELTNTPNYTGKELVLRRDQWTWTRSTITDHTNSTITYSGGDPTQSVKSTGYFLHDDLTFVDEYGEWFHDYGNTEKLYVYFGAEDPNSHVVKVASLTNCLEVDGTPWIYYVDINNLTFEGAIEYGNRFWGYKSEQVTISNCEYRFCGESAIWAEGCIGYEIYNNYIHDMPEGIYANASADWSVHNNLIEDIGLFPAAMRIKTNGSREAGINLSMGVSGSWYEPQEFTIEENTLHRIGYNAIHFKGKTVDVINNYITYPCLTQSDGGGIYTGGSGNTAITISGNTILYSSPLSAAGTGGTYSASEGIYLDEEADNATVINNTVAHSGNSGIKLHKGNSCTVQYNYVFDCTKGFSLENYEVANAHLNSLDIQNNVFVMKQSDQLGGIYYNAYPSGISVIGTMDNNTYSTPVYGASNFKYNGGSRTFTTWKSSTGVDTNSTDEEYSAGSEGDFVFEINPTAISKTITLVEPMKDFEGNLYPVGNVSIPAWRSLILIPQ